MSLFTPEKSQAWLAVGGREFAGWTKISIGASLENMARTFTFEAASRWPEELHLLRIRPGAAVEVWVGSDLLITGYVDKLDGSSSASAHKLSVSGRSKTGDLVDCSAIGDVNSFRKKEALSIAKVLAAPYAVTVRSVGDIGTAKLRRFDVQAGEAVGAAIQRIGLLRSFMVTDNAKGELVLTRAGAGEADVALVLGENVLSSTASVDVSGRFSEYRIKSVRVGDDNDYGEALQAEELAVDTEDLGRTRILELQSEAGEDKARCKDRATWEAATRYGQSISLVHTVQGWRQTEGGRLWEPNEIVYVVDDLIGVEGDFLIVDVDFTLDDKTTTKLSLAPIEGYEPLPPMKPRRRKRRPAKRPKNPYSVLSGGVDIGAQASGTGQSTEVTP